MAKAKDEGSKRVTLNRFPIFGLFAYRAARRSGYDDESARILGYSIALLFAIFKQGAGKGGKGKKGHEAKGPVVGKEEVTAPDSIQFGGHDFQCAWDEAEETILKTVVGGQVHTTYAYAKNIENKFKAGYHAKLVEAFDAYLETISKAEADSNVYHLYARFRDDKDLKVGWNRVDLDGLIEWCEKRAKKAA